VAELPAVEPREGGEHLRLIRRVEEVLGLLGVEAVEPVGVVRVADDRVGATGRRAEARGPSLSRQRG
jgi:hypothetical protein